MSVGQYIVNGTGVSHVTLRALQMYYSRGTAVQFHDGMDIISEVSINDFSLVVQLKNKDGPFSGCLSTNLD